MNQKSFASIFIAITVIVVVGISVYFVFVKEPTPMTEIATPEPVANSQQETPPAQETSPEVDETETQGWLTFTNNKYSYSFKHPQGTSVEGGQYRTDANEAFVVSLEGKQNSFTVEAQDPELFLNSPDDTVETMELPLKEFVQEIWEQNKEVGEISQTTVGGKVAYQFMLTGSYVDERGGYVLEGKYLYLFVENKGLNFMIWLPADDSISKDILNSFGFIE